MPSGGLQAKVMNRFVWGLLSAPLFAAELMPWFPPVWEFQGAVDYLYNYEDRIQTPLGSFNLPNPVNNAIFGLNLTVWPQWNTEIELLLGSNPASDVNFSYKAVRATGRYQWLNDVGGDPFALTSGITLFTTPTRFLTATSTWFHGNFNAEFHTAIGKEFTRNYEWCSRLWAYGGIGIANKGNPWWHAYAAWDIRPWSCFTLSALTELIYGTGNNNIDPTLPFSGYADLNHQFVNIGFSAAWNTLCWGNLAFNGWYNVHARNFPEDYYGVGFTWRFSFAP